MMKRFLYFVFILLVFCKPGFPQWHQMVGYVHQEYNECFSGALDFDLSPDNSIYVLSGYSYCDSPHYYWYRTAKSSDQGADWSFLTFSDYTSFSSIQCVAVNEIVMPRTDQLSSKIYVTSDDFTSLTQIPGSSTDGYFNDLDFISLERGLLLNFYPWELLGKVENGVYTYSSGDTVSFKHGAVQLLNDTTAYLLCRDLFVPNPSQTGNNMLLRTNDFGNTWTTVYKDSGYEINHFSFVNEYDGIMVGKQGKILITSDGGFSWSSMNSGITSNINYINSGNSINFCVGNDGLILRNYAGETEWEDISFGTMNYKKIKIDANNFGYILATGQYLSESKILASDLVLSNSEVSETSQFYFYPNPCRDQVFFSGSDLEKLNQIHIYNSTGQLVGTFTDNQKRNLDVSFLHTGFYTISFIFEDKELNSKLLKITD